MNIKYSVIKVAYVIALSEITICVGNTITTTMTTMMTAIMMAMMKVVTCFALRVNWDIEKYRKGKQMIRILER